MVAVYVHIYTSLFNMVIGDALIGCISLSILLKAFLNVWRN